MLGQNVVLQWLIVREANVLQLWLIMDPLHNDIIMLKAI